MLPKKLQKKIEERIAQNALRSLGDSDIHLIDFYSNDYLGFSKKKALFDQASMLLKEHNLQLNGATGSRLLSGNYSLNNTTEKKIASFHNSASALLFNSGYDANVGFFSSVPQKEDIIFYDSLSHASIRDGIKMSNAKTYKFKHNNLDDLKRLVSNQSQSRTNAQAYYIVTESVFSMDGDQPDLKEIISICKTYNCKLIVDEAHALGVIGSKGEGLVQTLGLEKDVFARIVTFGKALGCHGAVILGSKELIQYLFNFARSFIYTTALPPHSVATIYMAYNYLNAEENKQLVKLLKSNIEILRLNIIKYNISSFFIDSNSAIHSMILSGNRATKEASQKLALNGFNVKPILSPTVPKGKERLRICLHTYNTEEEIKNLVKLLATFVV